MLYLLVICIPLLEKDIPADIDSTNNTVQNYLFHDKSKI